MYKQYFGLRENPFNVNPDPRYLFLTRRTQQALDELIHGIRARRGLILLTGEVGTGKTTLINCLLDWLHQQEMPTAFIFNPHLETGNLVDLIAEDFALPPPDPLSKSTALMRLSEWLVKRYRAGQTPVLIVDEGQGLPTPVLEEIRMLLNLETPREKLLQIVLAGQPELEARLRRPELRQIRQRVTLQCRTEALSLEETHDYIQTRLNRAGANGKPIFESAAMSAVYFYSRGIPRVMNLISEDALISAFLNQIQPIPERIIAEVAQRLQFDSTKPLPPLFDSAFAMPSISVAPPSLWNQVPGTWTDRTQSDGAENSRSFETRAAIPNVVPRQSLDPAKEPVVPVLRCGESPPMGRNATACNPSSVSVSVPGVPTQSLVGVRRLSRRTALLSTAGARLLFGLAKNPVLLALPRRCHEVVAKTWFRFSSACRRFLSSLAQTISSPQARAGRSSPKRIIPRNRKGLRRPFQQWRQRSQAWKQGFLAFIGSLDLPQKTHSLRRWLRQPWNPILWRTPPDLRSFESRRRLSQKKCDFGNR